MATLPDSGFDRVAWFYDPLARLVFGSSLQQAQQVLLPFVPQQSKVLIIGGGSGWLLEQLCLSGKELEVLYLEASPAMLRRAQHRYHEITYQHQVTTTFRIGTEAALSPADRFDIILTPFLLDLFPEAHLQALMAKLHAVLAPGGAWLFADFWPTAAAPPRWQRLLLKLMYLFFGITSNVSARTLPDFAKQFDQLRLQEVFSASFYKEMVQAKVYKAKTDQEK